MKAYAWSVAMLLLLLAGPAAADDYVVPGRKLVLKRSTSGSEKTVLRLVSPSLPSYGAWAGGMDAHGLEMTIVSDTEGETTLEAPGDGAATSRWQHGGSGSSPNIRFVGGPSDPVRRVLVKDGVLKLKAVAVGLPLATAHGAVAVRLVSNTVRVCVRFEGPDVVRKDEPGKVVASDAPPGTLPDCSDESLGIGSPNGAFLE